MRPIPAAHVYGHDKERHAPLSNRSEPARLDRCGLRCRLRRGANTSGLDARRPRGFIVAATVGAVGGGLLAVAAGLGSLSTLLTPSTWLAALAFAVLSVTIYQSA